MRIYCETNFVLEVVLEQTEVNEAEALIELARTKKVELVFPALALFEAYSTVHRRRADRRALIQSVQQELGQVGRSLSMAEEAAALRDTLVRATQLVTDRYDDVRARLLEVARWIPLDAAILTEAMNLERQGLTAPDAMVLASVLHDARRAEDRSLFINKNSKDFGTPEVVDMLADVGCEMLSSIRGARARALAMTGQADT